MKRKQKNLSQNHPIYREYLLCHPCIIIQWIFLYLICNHLYSSHLHLGICCFFCLPISHLSYVFLFPSFSLFLCFMLFVYLFFLFSFFFFSLYFVFLLTIIIIQNHTKYVHVCSHNTQIYYYYYYLFYI